MTASHRPFDAGEYETRVIKPQRGRSGPLPDDDLCTRYAVDLDMTPDELAERIVTVRGLWIVRAQAGGYIGSVCEAFLRADDELREDPGDAMLQDIEWWRSQAPAADPPPDPGLVLPPLERRVDEQSRPAVPPDPVAEVTARADGVGIRVSWRPAAGHDTSISYRLVRQRGTVPTGPDDGVELDRTPGHDAVDQVPPVGALLGYAVFAGGAGGWSPPTGTTTQVVPPVADVRIAGTAGAVVAGWAVHPDATAVEVRRTADGSPGGEVTYIRVDGGRHFRDDTVQEGVYYRYEIVACYRTASHDEVHRAAPVAVRGASRPESTPVTDLVVAPVSNDDGLSVQVMWFQPVGAEVVVRRSAARCPWEFGDLVPRAEIAGFGTELTGIREVEQDRAALFGAVPPGLFYYTAFTMTDNGGLRGQDATADLRPPVRMLDATRRGGDIALAWAWPPEVSIADVSWDGAVRRITKRQYITDGGFRISGNPGAARFEVRSIVFGLGGEESHSAPAVVEIGGLAPRISYRLERLGNRLRGNVRCVVTLTSDQEVAACTVVLVAASQITMPAYAEAGTELARAVVRVGPWAGPAVIEASLPALRRPYWLRCFLLDSDQVRLVDPPVTQMKVS